jgi:predicted MFS family arabinose efflux permease
MAAICAALPPFRPARQLTPAATPAPATPPPPHSPPRAGRNWLGLGLLLRFPAVLVLSFCSFGMLFLDGVATVLYPVYCRSFLHAGAAGYGILVSAAGIGALLGVVLGAGLFGRLAPSLRIGAVILCGAPLFGLLRLAPDLPVAVVALGLATFAWGPFFVFERTLVQRLVPEDIRSRLFGARMTISSLGFPLGSAIGGALLGTLGVRTVIPAIACACLALGLLPLLAPALRRLATDTGSARSDQPGLVGDHHQLGPVVDA